MSEPGGWWRITDATGARKGAVWAQTEAEAIGKATVRYGAGGYPYTAVASRCKVGA